MLSKGTTGLVVLSIIAGLAIGGCKGGGVSAGKDGGPDANATSGSGGGGRGGDGGASGSGGNVVATGGSGPTGGSTSAGSGGGGSAGTGTEMSATGGRAGSGGATGAGGAIDGGAATGGAADASADRPAQDGSAGDTSGTVPEDNAGCAVTTEDGQAIFFFSGRPGLPMATLVNEQVMRLFPWPAPHQPADAHGNCSLDVPTIQVFLPAAGVATGAAAIVVPGGGYGHLSIVESIPVGRYLADAGVTAFVLRYRHGARYQFPVPMIDAERAIRTVRSFAVDWNLDPDRLAIVGFSAGGHLASYMTVNPLNADPASSDPLARVSTRLNRQVVLSPVITTAEVSGSRTALLGATPSAALIQQTSNEMHVTAALPSSFVWHAADDTTVNIVTNSDRYVAAMRNVGVPVEYVRPATGGHVGALDTAWSVPLLAWLRLQGYAR